MCSGARTLISFWRIGTCSPTRRRLQPCPAWPHRPYRSMGRRAGAAVRARRSALDRRDPRPGPRSWQRIRTPLATCASVAGKTCNSGAVRRGMGRDTCAGTRWPGSPASDGPWSRIGGNPRADRFSGRSRRTLRLYQPRRSRRRDRRVRAYPRLPPCLVRKATALVGAKTLMNEATSCCPTAPSGRH